MSIMSVCLSVYQAVSILEYRNWTKCLKKSACDVLKMRDYPSLFLEVFFATSPLISLIYMTSHGWVLKLFVNLLVCLCVWLFFVNLAVFMQVCLSCHCIIHLDLCIKCLKSIRDRRDLNKSVLTLESKGISQLQKYWCTSPMMFKKITPFVD